MKSIPFLICFMFQLYCCASELTPLRPHEEDQKRTHVVNVLSLLDRLEVYYAKNDFFLKNITQRIKAYAGPLPPAARYLTSCTTELFNDHINPAPLQAIKIDNEGRVCVTASVYGAVCTWDFLRKISLRHYIPHQQSESLIVAVDPEVRPLVALSLPFGTQRASLWDISLSDLKLLKDIVLPQHTHAFDINDRYIATCVYRPPRVILLTLKDGLQHAIIPFTQYNLFKIRLHPNGCSVLSRYAQKKCIKKPVARRVGSGALGPCLDAEILGPYGLSQYITSPHHKKRRSLLIAPERNFLAISQSGNDFISQGGTGHSTTSYLYAQSWQQEQAVCHLTHAESLVSIPLRQSSPAIEADIANINDQENCIVYSSQDTRIVRVLLPTDRFMQNLSMTQWCFLFKLASYVENVDKRIHQTVKPIYMFDEEHVVIFHRLPKQIQERLELHMRFIFPAKTVKHESCIIA